MSSGIGFFELVLLFVIGLLILGPEKLPRVATQIGRWVGRARRTANQLRYQLEREISLADIDSKPKHKRNEPKPKDESSHQTGSAADQAQANESSASDETIAGSARPDAEAGATSEAPAADDENRNV